MLDGGQEPCLVLLKCNVISKISMSSTTSKTTMTVAAFASLLAVAAITSVLQNQVAFAERKEVEYTFTIASLGQGIWGGGPLYSDGSAGGNVAFSAGNGETIFQIRAVSWEEIGDGEAVDICFETKEIKGDAFFPPEFCLSETFGALPVTGGPVVDDGFLFRVTEVGN